MDKQDELAAVIAPHLLAMSEDYSDVPVEHIWTRPRYQHLAARIDNAAAAVRSYMGSDEVVERVAEAICDYTREMHRYEDLDAHNRRFWQEHARAALSAALDIGGGRG